MSEAAYHSRRSASIAATALIIAQISTDASDSGSDPNEEHYTPYRPASEHPTQDHRKGVHVTPDGNALVRQPDILERVISVSVYGDRCSITHVDNTHKTIETCHLIPMAMSANVNNLKELRKLEYALGLKPGELSVNTRLNLFRLTSNLHKAFDSGIYGCIPQMDEDIAALRDWTTKNLELSAQGKPRIPYYEAFPSDPASPKITLYKMVPLSWSKTQYLHKEILIKLEDRKWEGTGNFQMIHPDGIQDLTFESHVHICLMMANLCFKLLDDPEAEKIHKLFLIYNIARRWLRLAPSDTWCEEGRRSGIPMPDFTGGTPEGASNITQSNIIFPPNRPPSQSTRNRVSFTGSPISIKSRVASAIPPPLTDLSEPAQQIDMGMLTFADPFNVDAGPSNILPRGRQITDIPRPPASSQDRTQLPAQTGTASISQRDQRKRKTRKRSGGASSSALKESSAGEGKSSQSSSIGGSPTKKHQSKA